jgi:acyl-CoA thioesterase FadM
VQVWIDYDAGRPVPISEALKQQLSAAVEALA